MGLFFAIQIPPHRCRGEVFFLIKISTEKGISNLQSYFEHKHPPDIYIVLRTTYSRATPGTWLMGSSSPPNNSGPPQQVTVTSSSSTVVQSVSGDVSAHETDSQTAIRHAGKPRRSATSPLITSHTPVDEAEVGADPGLATGEEKPITWSSLPRKGQLAILTLARLSEPLTQTSLQAYLFYQLRSFDPSLPTSTISAQAGILQGSFTAAQFLTAFWWGRLADAEWMGRKRVLLIGLLGTCISCLGFGFSRNFTTAIVFRTLNGMLNSNVGVMRTMVSEIIVEKKYVPFLGLLRERKKN